MKTTMIDINDEAIKKCKLNKSAEALVFLKRAEKTLEVINKKSHFFEEKKSLLPVAVKASTETLLLLFYTISPAFTRGFSLFYNEF